jgi:hypothetical protein
MVFLSQLWLPILVSAVFVFVVSAVVHMLLPYHQDEWSPAPSQDALQAALRGCPPGMYGFPMAENRKDRMSAEWMKRWMAGPTGWLTVMPVGGWSMGKSLGQSFALNVVISFFTAYVAGHALSMGAGAPHYLAVFRVTGTIGFMTYGLAAAYECIWYGRPWRSFAFTAFDALLFGLVMGGAFGWLWPR